MHVERGYRKAMRSTPDGPELERMYSARFSGKTEYRKRVWAVLSTFLGQWFPKTGVVLDLGAGYCEFINSIQGKVKYAMDLNPDVGRRAAEGVKVLKQDCTQPWPLPQGELDAVFTSNFLEHLPDKGAVRAVISNAYRCLKAGGCIVALGPNIKYLPGAYWDFFDHHVELTDLSLSEALTNCHFEIEERIPRFLPYTMSDGRHYPIWMLRLYLRMPFIWPIFGKQFLVVGRKPLKDS